MCKREEVREKETSEEEGRGCGLLLSKERETEKLSF